MKASDVMIGAREEFFCHALTIRRSRPLAGLDLSILASSIFGGSDITTETGHT